MSLKDLDPKEMYVVQFVLDSSMSMELTNQNRGDDATGISDVVELEHGEQNLAIDAELISPTVSLELSSREIQNSYFSSVITR